MRKAGNFLQNLSAKLDDLAIDPELRRILTLLSADLESEEAFGLAREYMRIHPETDYRFFRKSAAALGIADESALQDLFFRLELTNAVDMLLGDVPVESCWEPLRPFIKTFTKAGLGIVLAKTTLNLKDEQSPVVYQPAPRLRIGFACQPQNLNFATPDIRIANRKVDDGKYDVRVEIDRVPGTVVLQTDQAPISFPLNNTAVRDFMAALTPADFKRMMAGPAMKSGAILQDELKSLLEKKYIEALTGLVYYLQERRELAGIRRMEISIRERIPFFYRSVDEKKMGNRTDYLLTSESVEFTAQGSLNYVISEDMFCKDSSYFDKRLMREIPPLVNISY
jgi:hypothetical protein